MSTDERTRAVQARWSSRDPRGVFPVIPCLCCVIERETETRVYRDVHDAATETMCSPGQHNEALSRTTWFECTSDEKGGKRCAAPYATTHHIIFPQLWMRPSHRQPLLLSDSQSQNLSQHVLYTMQWKTLSWVCTKWEPLGRTRSVFRLQEHRALQRESCRERDGFLFSEI